MLSLYIALRYTRAKRRNHFISFISLTSLLGIALGVCVLITVLSVMNGFSEEVQHRILNMTPHISVSRPGELMDDWHVVQADMLRMKQVTGAAPYIDGQGMLMKAGRMQGVLIRGVEPSMVDAVYPLSSVMRHGQLTDLEDTPFGVLLGYPIADSLGISVGDKVTLAIPEATVSLAGVAPRMRQMTVVGLFDSGYLYDNTHIFVHLRDMVKLYNTNGLISGIQCRTTDPFLAPIIANRIQSEFAGHLVAEPWTWRHAHYFQAVQMEKTMMFFILLLIIAVAAFNLVSTLVMMVTDKTTDIAILRTMGASKRQVMGIFVWQGAIVGLLGTGVGTGLGIWLSLNVSEVAAFIEQLAGRQLLTSDIYLIDYLPSLFLWTDAIQVCLISLLLSLLATLYPAWRGASLSPVEGLRHG